jgi:Domain of unknown function DUF11
VNVAAAITVAPTTTAAITPATADISVQAQPTLRPELHSLARTRLQVRNGGPADDSTTTLALTLPAQVRLVAAVPQAGICNLKALTCQLGPLAAYQSDVVVLTLRAVTAGKGHLLARVSGVLPDTSTSNNDGTISVEIPSPPPHPKTH